MDLLNVKNLFTPTPPEQPIRFVQIGSVSGETIALPSAVLRSAPITLMGSGLGSVSL